MEHTQEQVNKALALSDEFRRTHATGEFPATVTILADEVRRLSEEITDITRLWHSDQAVFCGALQILKEAGKEPGSAELIAAAERFDATPRSVYEPQDLRRMVINPNAPGDDAIIS